MLSRLDSPGNGERPKSTIRLTLAQALAHFLAAQRTIVQGSRCGAGGLVHSAG
jgi:hypothetical protein